ncbi:hypothetical protein WAX74_12710 [Psychrobacillus sp. FJAT-51614]|uniref:Uncharacterized protein n=1 Tax=Psychrobacillus mangrovi TaxID=3117745 RepID=A0ABU8F656_9BACI
MPNWSRGIIEIKGKGKDIKRFLVDILGEDAKEVIDTGEKIILRPDIYTWFKGTNRNYIEGQIEFEYNYQENDSHFEDNGFMAAWYVEPEPYQVFSKQYDLEFKISVVEVLGGFEQKVHIQNGKVVKNIAKEIFIER